MGYVNSNMAQAIPVSLMQFVTGTWADAVDSNVWTKNKTATDETATVRIPVALATTPNAQEGAKLESVEIHFEVETAALDALSAAMYKAAMPVDGSALVPAEVTVTYDTGHDTAAERIDVDHHQMTLTVSTPFRVEEDELVWVEISVDAAATSVYKQGDAIANFRLRV